MIAHRCFGCGKHLRDHEAHIHVGLDAFAAKNGLGALGLDDLFTFAFCEACTEKSDDGWQLESHEIGDDAA
jgi:hypothetical protein